MNNQAAQTMPLPPSLPEWSRMDNLGGAVPSEVRQALIAMYQQGHEAGRAPGGEGGITKEQLDWLVSNEYDLCTRREDIGDDEYAIWWFVVDSRKSTKKYLHTVSGHPLGSPQDAIQAAMQEAVIAAAPAASGGEACACIYYGLRKAPYICEMHKARKATPQPPSGASVSERAREILAQTYEASAQPTQARLTREDSMTMIHFDTAIRAIERALSSPRQEGETVAWRFVTENHRHGPQRGHWRDVKDAGMPPQSEDLADGVTIEFAYTTPHPSTAASTQGLRELVQRWRSEIGRRDLNDPWDKGRDYTLKACAEDLESLLTSPTTGADGGGE